MIYKHASPIFLKNRESGCFQLTAFEIHPKSAGAQKLWLKSWS